MITNTPWEHDVKDQFLSPEDYDTISNYVSNWPKPQLPGHKIFVPLTSFDHYDKTEAHQVEALKTFNILLPYAVKYFDSVYGLNDLEYIIIEYVACSKGYRYKKHSDATSKLASGVLYFSKNGRPTRMFCSKDKVFRHRWKPNRMFSFYNSKDKIHDYGADEERITFNITYMEKKATQIHWPSKIPGNMMSDKIITEIRSNKED